MATSRHGAWFSLLHDDAQVDAAIVQALVTSHGSLDSPPLIVASIGGKGHSALNAIAIYLGRDLDAHWGASGFAAAAVEHLGAADSRCTLKDNDRGA